MIENAKSLLQTVQNTLTTANKHNKSTQQFLQDINLDVEAYMDALPDFTKRSKCDFKVKAPQDAFIYI